MSEFVDYQVKDGVATLTMNDGKANVFGFPTTSALSKGLDRAADEAEVAVIKGKPGLFCAGYDLKVINGSKDGVRVMVESGAELLLKAYTHSTAPDYWLHGPRGGGGGIAVVHGGLPRRCFRRLQDWPERDLHWSWPADLRPGTGA